jgi:hypothetical protein
LATLSSTLDPTRDLILERARLAGAEVSVRAVVVEGAFEAVVSGDVDRHDQLVGAALGDLAGTSDLIVLAQASIARVLDQLGPDRPTIPVLSSPRLAVERLASMLVPEPVSP